MSKIKDKLIHLLGGFTENEYDNMCAISYQALTHLNKENKQLRENLRILEHAVEDSRATGTVNVVRVEKPIKTFRMQHIISQESLQTEEEQIVYAKRKISEQFANMLLKNDLIDFKVSNDNYNFDKRITGTIYVREP